jgi:diaminopimelate epimerase
VVASGKERRSLYLQRLGGRLIPFAKAHACGNDFLIVTEEAAQGRDCVDLARKLCARNTGIGADGIEFFTWTGPNSGRIRLYNADGSIAEISGNGTRTVAAWMALERGFKQGDELRIETDAGLRVCRVNSLRTDGEFTVEVTAGMGVPAFAPRTVTLASGLQAAGVDVSTGNPHFVIVAENAEFSVAGLSWQQLGAEICTHPDFPQQTNVEFLRIASPTKIEIRIFERGVGPTTSSGTGSSATATAAIALNGCQSPLTVAAPGGAQTIAWSGPGSELYLTGPASLIARGEAWAA